MNSRFLITGGAGFIGSHLAGQLLAAGNDVTILDDLSTGRDENIAAFKDHPKFSFIRDSVENPDTVNVAVASSDYVFHLASAVGVQLIVDQPVRTIRTTIHGTEVVLEAAHRFGKPVLITSSSEVYGKTVKVPFDEDDDIVMGATRYSRWCYAYSKGIDEFLGLAYHQQYGLPVTIVRLFNTVGPGQVGQYGMVLPRFVEAALKNLPLQVYGDGRQTRCFCHVSDVVSAMIKLSSSANAGRVFNLGSDEEISILDLAKKVIAMTGAKSEIEFVSYEKAYGRSFDDLTRRVPKLDRIQRAIGFKASLKIESIIESVIAHAKAV